MDPQTIEKAVVRGTVIEIKPANGAGRSATLNLQSGERLGIFPDKLGLVNRGGSYEFDVTRKLKGNVWYSDVDKVRAIAPNDVVPPSHQRTEAPQANGHAHAPQQQPKYPATPGVDWHRPTHPRDGERMFVSKMLGDFIQAGRIVAVQKETLVQQINVLRATWAETFGQDDQ